jgi:hypothetical protein
MAKQENNVVTHGLKGKIGGLLVFRNRHGQTIVSKIPERSSRPLSEKQKEHQKRFQKAVIYATIATQVEETKDLYADAAQHKKGVTAYNMAVADFLNAPSIEDIDLSGYTGEIGSEIKIIVTDDFMVKFVHIQISNEDGSLLEEGEAENRAGALWVYKASQNNPNSGNAKIEITASDLPGNITKEEVLL